MEEKARTERKLKKALQMLLFREHRLPGLKGWELKKALGNDWQDIIGLLNDELDKFGLDIKGISEGGTEDASSYRYVIRLKDTTIQKATGKRIDQLGMLSASIAMISSRDGKIDRKELEKFLGEKFQGWRVTSTIERFIREGYLSTDGKLLFLGWRTQAEIDPKDLLNLVLSS
jgi:hypothetical protein